MGTQDCPPRHPKESLHNFCIAESKMVAPFPVVGVLNVPFGGKNTEKQQYKHFISKQLFEILVLLFFYLTR